MHSAACLVNISGMGCITAAGTSLGQTLYALEQGTSQPSLPYLFTVDTAHPVFHCNLPDRPEDWQKALSFPVDLPTLARLNRTTQVATWATDQALAQAGLTAHELGTRRVGVCLGTSVGAALDFHAYYTAYKKGDLPPLDEIYQYRRSNPALAIAELFHCTGLRLSVVNACSSGTDALGLAASWIRNNSCDIVIAGGADALAYITYLGFKSLRITSPEACKPFDVHRKGLTLGEGAGIVILESEASLSARKALSIGTILGYGTCTDAYHITAPHPEARGLNMAVQQALVQAELSPDALAFINAHGTATLTNDAVEGSFIRKNFPETPFIATKGCTGHTLGAAGAIEAILTLAHLHAGILPPSPAFSEADPAIGVSPVAIAHKVTGDIALSQSLAFGGNNSAVILKKENTVCSWQ